MSFFISLTSIFIVALIVIVTCVCLNSRHKNILLWICFGFVVLGCFIYTISYLSFNEGSANPLFAALRGIFSTARMFFLNDDYFVLMSTQGAKWLTENVGMQILFWLCHISALVLVSRFVFLAFGKGIFDEFRLRFGSHQEVYIIKGSNKNALILGENIATHDTPEGDTDANRLVIFLLGEDEDAKKVSEKVSHFDGVVQVLNRNHNLLHYLKKARLIKWCEHETKCNIPSKICDFIESWHQKMRGCKKKYSIILTSDNVSTPKDVNLIVTSAKDHDVAQDKLNIFVFTSSEWDRKEIEAITQAKEGGKRQYPYTFHIMNEVDLVTRQMIKMEKHAPFECPGLQFSNGMAARDFTVMVLGFGTVGQSALLHLIMNGQFVGSRMRAIIIDKNIYELCDCFLQRYPYLDLCCEMEFKKINVQCNEFFNLLHEENNVDYIVIALHNNEINKQIALNIQSHYKRRDVNSVPFIAVSEKNGSLHEAEKDKEIFTFGCREEIYKESVIIREEVDLMAKEVHEAYGGEPPWHELDWFYQESNRAVADFIPAMLMLADITEENAMNNGTLTEDSTLAEILAQTEKLRWNAFHAAMGYSPLSIEKMQERFAKYDGERAGKDNSKKLLAYSRKDPDVGLHICLASWDEIDNISEAYRELARYTDAIEEKQLNFKDYDRAIVTCIPKSLNTAKKKNQ